MRKFTQEILGKVAKEYNAKWKELSDFFMDYEVIEETAEIARQNAVKLVEETWKEISKTADEVKGFSGNERMLLTTFYGELTRRLNEMEKEKSSLKATRHKELSK